MHNARGDTESNKMLIYRVEKSICKQSKHGTYLEKYLEKRNLFLGNRTKKISHESNGRVTSDQVDREIKK
jgi:hypothetical protein